MLQPALPGKDGRTRVGLADYFDFSVYVDARTEDIETLVPQPLPQAARDRLPEPVLVLPQVHPGLRGGGPRLRPHDLADHQQAQPAWRTWPPPAAAPTLVLRKGPDHKVQRLSSAQALSRYPDRHAASASDRPRRPYRRGGRACSRTTVGTTHLVVLAGRRPRPGRATWCCATWPARPATNSSAACGRWASTGRGSIAVEDIDLSLSRRADQAEEEAPGRGRGRGAVGAR